MLGRESEAEKRGYDEKGLAKGQSPVTEPAFDGEPPKPQEDVLHRGLKSRQVSMIAIGGAVGTGLIIGSGTALTRGGPLGMLIAYSIMGMMCFLVMAGLGEIATWQPHRKGFSGYVSRFVDESAGVATGYNYLFKYLIVTPNNVVAASVVLQYWPGANKVPIAVFITVFNVAILIINFAGIRFFGEFEFWLSLIKVITLVGLLIMSICLTSGANPSGDVIWFSYWKNPGPFSHYKVGGAKGAFLGFWACMVNALFAYIGTELIGVTVGECENPRRNIPSAIKKTFWRIVIFYIGGVFCIGLLVASNDPAVFVASRASTSAAASPFVVALVKMGVNTLPSILNAAILIFVLSAANSDLYIASRTLYALAEEGKAPAIFTRVNKTGVPYYSLLLCWLFTALAYLRVTKSGSVVFGYFVNMVSLFGGIAWIMIASAHIRFVNATKAQGFDRSRLRYRAPFGAAGSWVALIVTAIVCFFKGWDSFVPKFTLDTFMTNYIGIVAFIAIYAYYKLRHRTKLIPLNEVDLISGVAEIDADEQFWLDKAAAKGPLNFWQRLGDRFI